MDVRLRTVGLVVGALLVSAIYSSTSSSLAVQPSQQVPPRPAVGDPVAASRYAWYLFMDAMRPSLVSNAPRQFETWTEQCDLQPALCGGAGGSGGAVATMAGQRRVRRANGSALGRRLSRSDAKVGCSPMNTQGFPNIPATNVASGAVFCEEVFVNSAEAKFVTGNSLITIAGQQKHGAVTFPLQSVEIKVDWVPQASFTKPFTCPGTDIYTEMIQFEGDAQPKCYALVGMHISSKVLPDWLWATWEPNSSLTNPNRCNQNLYGLCFDPWGTTSPKPYQAANTPAQSAALAAVMKGANLPPQFNNYYLTGAQTQFVVGGQATQLGNSFVEYNAGVQPGQASCITCHRYAYAGTPAASLGGPLPGWPSTGYACNTSRTANCLPPTGQTWTSEDFSWMLGIMPAK